jgi:hypothetical protein
MEQDIQQPGVAVGKLIFGLCLLVVGVAAFLGAIDAWNARHYWKFWPLLLVVIGLGNEAEALRRRKSDGSYVLVAIGCWLLVGMFHLFGLSIREAIPVGLVVAGLGVVLHALVDRPVISEKEKDNVR